VAEELVLVRVQELREVQRGLLLVQVLEQLRVVQRLVQVLEQR
jgi:hypothetical protein